MEDDDEAAWNGWEVGSDSSDSSEGWQDVASEGEDFDVSDSDDEKPKSGGPVGEIEQPEKEISKEPAEEPAEEQAQRLSTLATTKVR
jgi:protein SDA1